jgi:hypothetical protein
MCFKGCDNLSSFDDGVTLTKVGHAKVDRAKMCGTEVDEYGVYSGCAALM